ncbi:ATP-grasp domain-containing protein [Streptomyces sp. NPDC000229]|uniref:ATP-grasp domain-containing protein n=1 Tax=Streptomyces sp. NPDC000229 TaxID=3154247 RepID=UPI0033311EAB
MTNVLVLGGAAAPATGFVRDICERAMNQFTDRGARIVLTDTAENLAAAPDLAARAAETHVLDFADPAACRAWAVEHARTHTVDAVVGYRESAGPAVAAVAQALGLPGNSPDAVRRIRVKDAARSYLADCGFLQPALRLCAGPEEILAFLAECDGPVVVKPRTGSNSQGVSRVDRAEDAGPAYRAARDAEGLVLAEEFVHGREYSVEGLIAGGTPHILAVTAKQLFDGTFVEAGHAMPAPLTARDEGDIVLETRAALLALGITTGPFHVECWTTERGVVLGEFHARQGGDWIHAMLEWCNPGFELYGTWLDDLLGRPVQLPKSPSRGAVSQFFSLPPGVSRPHGWEEVLAHPRVMAGSLATTLTAGAPVTSNLARHGSLVVTGADTAEARWLAERLLAGLMHGNADGGRKRTAVGVTGRTG